uniref:Uncharacterized protein n=1 Tax=Spongospora subterranea TaxID=70186 RepID=A0A0H5QVH7_9EUKA|eukprot:CRZ05601.1 hypothetical protein [Spongospora subterranea]
MNPSRKVRTKTFSSCSANSQWMLLLMRLSLECYRWLTLQKHASNIAAFLKSIDKLRLSLQERRVMQYPLHTVTSPMQKSTMYIIHRDSNVIPLVVDEFINVLHASVQF